MTNRDFLTAIINGKITANEIDFANAELAKLDKRNAKRRNTLTKEQKANEGVKVEIMAYITEHANAVASEIATACGISTQKASALCRQLVESGAIVTEEVKVKGKGKVKGYSVPVTDEENKENEENEG